ncbi:MAG: HAD family hydrolase [Alphaproteobacteria bacterium]|nr:HAD family hydrolase [Alphaproteobacteria bacterium]
MKNRKLAIFDWNGTLLADTALAWKATKPCLEFYDRPPISLKKQRETFDFPVIHFYKRNGCDIDRVLATKEESNNIFQEHYDKLALKARTRCGARELLDWLKDRDVTCIILSNYIEKKIIFHLERLNIRHYFSTISANTCNGETVLDTMNKFERLSDYMVKRGFRPDDSFIIGDSKEEPDIGRRLSIFSIGITNGCISEKRLRAAKPDHIISALPQTIDVLKNKWGI